MKLPVFVKNEKIVPENNKTLGKNNETSNYFHFIKEKVTFVLDGIWTKRSTVFSDTVALIFPSFFRLVILIIGLKQI